MKYSVKNVAILGLGTLGAQIALQSVVSGYRVRAYDPDEKALKRFLETSIDSNRIPLKSNRMDLSKWKEAADRVDILSSLREAVRGADLVIEVVPEDLEHVTPFFYCHPDRFRIMNIESGNANLADASLAVDTIEDLQRLEGLPVEEIHRLSPPVLAS